MDCRCQPASRDYLCSSWLQVDGGKQQQGLSPSTALGLYLIKMDPAAGQEQPAASYIQSPKYSWDQLYGMLLSGNQLYGMPSIWQVLHDVGDKLFDLDNTKVSKLCKHTLATIRRLI